MGGLGNTNVLASGRLRPSVVYEQVPFAISGVGWSLVLDLLALKECCFAAHDTWKHILGHMQSPRTVVNIRERHYTFRMLSFRTALPEAFFVPFQSLLLFQEVGDSATTA
eukprot:2476330-Amphidinium_carterae.1